MITVVCIMLKRFSASHTIVAVAGIEEERSISGIFANWSRAPEF